MCHAHLLNLPIHYFVDYIILEAFIMHVVTVLVIHITYYFVTMTDVSQTIKHYMYCILPEKDYNALSVSAFIKYWLFSLVCLKSVYT